MVEHVEMFLIQTPDNINIEGIWKVHYSIHYSHVKMPMATCRLSSSFPKSIQKCFKQKMKKYKLPQRKFSAFASLWLKENMKVMRYPKYLPLGW